MKIIGLTGGIATGKSTVSKIIMELGIPVIDADQIAREIVEPGKAAHREIKDFFGQGVLQKDGTLNRQVLGEMVFSNPTLLAKLNEITHPRILQVMESRLEKMKDTGVPLVVLDIPLLLEGGSQARAIVDEIWLVVCDYNTQIGRLILRNGLTRKEAEARIKAQIPLKEKIKYAHRIIDNSGDINETARQVKIYIGEL
jgi:dephospho-CoA kinase